MHFELQGPPSEQLASLLEGNVLEIGSPENVWGDNPGATFQDEWDEALPANHVITFAKGGAPYDDIGFAILEVASLDSFAGREPDTRRPEEWPEEG